MAKASKAWGAIADQTARLAEEGRQISKPVASKPDEAIAAQPHTSPGFRTPADWAAKEAAEKQAPAAALIAAGPKSEAIPISRVEKKSTSLYLSGAASRATSSPITKGQRSGLLLASGKPTGPSAASAGRTRPNWAAPAAAASVPMKRRRSMVNIFTVPAFP